MSADALDRHAARLDPVMHDAHAPWGRDLQGSLLEYQIASSALAGNPLGDPTTRPLWVLTPPHVAADEATPTIYLIQGFTGHVAMWRHRVSLRESPLERLDAALAEPDHPPVRLVFVDQHCPTLPERAHRGIAGKSSGGYGAMITPMLRPDVFGALATHAGDALFEACFATEFPRVARALREHHDGSYQAFWQDWSGRPHGSRADDDRLLMLWAMAACWSAGPDGTVSLPFDIATGRIVDDVWQRWLEWDPVRMVSRHADALRALRAIWIDAGTRDQFWLDLGATAFRDALAAIGVTPTHFELFDATHLGIEYRYPLAVRHLAERLQP